jgi:acyl carrier protein
MNCFRYDAILHVGPSPQAAAEPARLAWTSADEVAYQLTERRPDTAVIAAVPNLRTARHVLAWQLIQDGADTTARDLRALPADAVDPDFFPAWADRMGYDASVGWLLDDGGSGTYDVLLRRRGALAGLPDSALLGDVQTEPVAGSWYEPHVNQPHSYTTAGPAVGGDGSIAGTIEAIWRGVLERKDIDPEANFFDLGGHSLMLVHVLQQLRATVGPDLQLVDLFQHTTVRGLVAHLGSRAEDPTDDDRRPLPTDRRRALRRQRDHRKTV